MTSTPNSSARPLTHHDVRVIVREELAQAVDLHRISCLKGQDPGLQPADGDEQSANDVSDTHVRFFQSLLEAIETLTGNHQGRVEVLDHSTQVGSERVDLGINGTVNHKTSPSVVVVGSSPTVGDRLDLGAPEDAPKSDATGGAA